MIRPQIVGGWLIRCASVTVNWRAISIRLISIGKCCVIDKKLEFGNVQFNWRSLSVESMRSTPPIIPSIQCRPLTSLALLVLKAGFDCWICLHGGGEKEAQKHPKEEKYQYHVVPSVHAHHWLSFFSPGYCLAHPLVVSGEWESLPIIRG